MKKRYIILLLVVLISVISVNAQETRQMMTKSKVNEFNIDYIEKLGGKAHDQLTMKLNDGRTLWSAQTIDGFHLMAKAGANNNYGYIVGAGFGYSHQKFDTDVIFSMSEREFLGQTYHAPSAFFEFKPTLFKWGKNKMGTNKIYIGGIIGYQHAKSLYHIEESTPEYDFEFESESEGSGLAYGATIGWEMRRFMSPNRIGMQVSAYTYDVDHIKQNTLDRKQQWVVEVTFSYKFVFQKKAKNY